jgi:hypothetical protein
VQVSEREQAVGRGGMHLQSVDLLESVLEAIGNMFAVESWADSLLQKLWREIVIEKDADEAMGNVIR